MRKILLVPALIVLAGVAVVIIASVARSSSAAQNANSPTTTNRNENRSIAPAPGARPQEDFSKNTWELPDDCTSNGRRATVFSVTVRQGRVTRRTSLLGDCDANQRI
jgi:hypothetical protein